MNQRNVDVLRAIVLEMAEEFTTALDGLEYDQQTIERVAVWLADRVLVPAVFDVDFKGQTWAPCPLCGDALLPSEVEGFRAKLARVARGDALL